MNVTIGGVNVTPNLISIENRPSGNVDILLFPVNCNKDDMVIGTYEATDDYYDWTNLRDVYSHYLVINARYDLINDNTMDQQEDS